MPNPEASKATPVTQQELQRRNNRVRVLLSRAERLDRERSRAKSPDVAAHKRTLGRRALAAARQELALYKKLVSQL